MMKPYFPRKEVRWMHVYLWEDPISNRLLWYRTRVSTRIPYHCKAYFRSIVSVVCTHLSSSLRQDSIAERGTTFQFAICSFHLVCPGVWSIGQKGNPAIARTCGHYDSQRCHILNHIIPPAAIKNRTFFFFLQSTIYAQQQPPFTTPTHNHSLTHITATFLSSFAHLSLSPLAPRSLDLDSNHTS